MEQKIEMRIQTTHMHSPGLILYIRPKLYNFRFTIIFPTLCAFLTHDSLIIMFGVQFLELGMVAFRDPDMTIPNSASLKLDQSKECLYVNIILIYTEL
jgi:hypothetical protein